MSEPLCLICGETMQAHRHGGKCAMFTCANPAADEIQSLRQRVERLEGILEALGSATCFSAYRASDPLAIRFEFANDDDRVAAADAVDQFFLLGVHGIRAALSPKVQEGE